MKVEIFDTPEKLGKAAGERSANLVRSAIQEKGFACIIMATGNSQFETIKHLTADKEIDWGKVVMFHLDEYIGISENHPASFRKYLKERFIDKIGTLKDVFLINGETDPVKEVELLNKSIQEFHIDVALVGIGENGHLAFNDPPADFDTDAPFIMVRLDEACRMQQLNEGWFSSLEEVPHSAISMSVKQIMKSGYVICSVPEKRKAIAVKNCLANKISPLYPASILQNHEHCVIYLDKESSSLLKQD
ncbi:MAG: glucosamine-6-phosphate deaminase [Bacteroidetes bacterium]|nr:glucosamine-6-phosphate deaminase [Bacteroidota bacterium]